MSLYKLSNSLLKIKMNSVNAGKIYISILFVNLLICHYYSTIDLFQQNYELEDTLQQQILAIVKYVGIQGLLALDPMYFYVAYILLSGIIFGFDILFLISFIHQLKNKLNNIGMYTHGKLFVKFQEAIIWIFLQPIYIVYWSIIVCNKDILQDIEFSCSSDPVQYYISITFTSLLLGLTLFTSLMLSLFFTNDRSSKKDCFATGNNLYFSYFNIFQFIVTLTMCLRIKGTIYLIFYLLFNFLGSELLVLEIIYGNSQMFFSNTEMRKWFTTYLNVYVGMSFGFLIDELMRQINYNTFDNTILLLIVTIFGCIKVNNALQKISMKKYLLQKVLIGDDLRKKIIYLNQLIATQNDVNNLNLLGIVIEHMNQNCISNQICFCQQKRIFLPKKQKDLSVNMIQIYKTKQDFMKFLIKSLYENYLFHNANDHFIRLEYANYLNHQLGLQYIAIDQLKQVQKNAFSPITKCQIYNSIKNIQEELIEKGNQSYQGQLDFEFVLIGEQMINQIYEILSEIIELKIKFWKLMSKQIIFEDELINIDQQISFKQKQCQQVWKLMRRFKHCVGDKIIEISLISKRHRWQFLFSWYKMNILNKMLKKSEIDFATELSSKIEIINEDSASENEEIQGDPLAHQKPFNHQSAIFHSNAQGKIISYSQTCTQIFGFEDFSTIDQFQPKIFRRNHKMAMKDFLTMGKKKNLYKKRKILCQNSDGHLVQCRKYLKWNLNQQNNVQFICMIRPIIQMQKINYIILNEDWECENYTPELDLILKNKVSLLFLCPKLLLFTKYGQIMTDRNYEIFKLKRLVYQDENKVEEAKLTDANFTDSKITTMHIINASPKMQDPESLVMDHQTIITENSNVLSNALLDDEIDIPNTKFRKIVDEQHVKLTLRIPKLFTQMIDEYQENKINILIDSFMSLAQSVHHRRIVYRNEKGILKINKNTLFRRISKLQSQYEKKMLQNYSMIFEKYCSKIRLLERVLKIDATIKFTQQTFFDKFIIIKINKFSVIEKNQIDIRKNQSKYLTLDNSTQQFNTNDRYRFSIAQVQLQQQQQLLQYQLHQEQQQQQQQQLQLSEIDSHRTNFNKTLLTDVQFYGDFQSAKNIDINLNLNSNIFLKEENNKAAKSSQQITLFKYFSRVTVICLLAFNIGTIFNGPTFNMNQLDDQGLDQVLQLIRLMRNMLRSYEIAVDSYLFNSNTTKQYILDNHLTNYSNGEEYFIDLENEVHEITRQTYVVYNDEYFVKMFYGGVIDGDSIIDLYDSYQANLVLLNHTILSAINQDNQILEMFRMIIITDLKVAFQNSIHQILNISLQIYEKCQNTLQILIFLLTSVITIILIINIANIKQTINNLETMYLQLHYIEKEKIFDINYFLINVKEQIQVLKSTAGILQFNNQISTQLIQLNRRNDNINKELLKNQPTKSATYMQSKMWKDSKIKLIGTYVFVSFAISISCFYYNFYNQTVAYEYTYLINQNKFFQQTKQVWVTLIIKELYINDVITHNNINTTAYIESINDFIDSTSGVYPDIYQTTIQSLSDLFYLNMCYDNSTQCTKLLNGALNRGFKAYVSLLTQFAKSYVNKEQIYDEFSLYRLVEFGQLQNYVSTFLDDARQQFEVFYDDSLSNSVKLEEIIMICCFALIVISHIFLIEIILIRNLNLYFQQARQYYKNYYPNELLNYQKRTRAKLIKVGIIKK